jgi:hypothetical protein
MPMPDGAVPEGKSLVGQELLPLREGWASTAARLCIKRSNKHVALLLEHVEIREAKHGGKRDARVKGSKVVASRFGLEIDDLRVTCLPEHPRCIHHALYSRSIEDAGQTARRINFCSFDAEYWSEHTP